jgi:chorismate mutase
MIETHNNPSVALSDSEQQITPKLLKKIIINLVLRHTKLRDKKFKQKLLNFRSQIDDFDKKIIELLNDRKAMVEHIAELKHKNSLTIFQIERWFEILNTRKENAKILELDEQMIEEIFTVIHKHSILFQTKVMRK